MIHFDFMLEELSAEEALRNLLPRIRQGATYRVHTFQGKQDLLSKLPDRLRCYRDWIQEGYRIVVLVDEDRDDCQALKQRLEDMAAQAGLLTLRASSNRAQFQVINRLAIEELEAWFFGDIEALLKAYPRLPKNLAQRKTYRDPDAILGGTWEALERVLKKAGYYPGGMPKVEVARKVSSYMDPNRNRSRSFAHFCDALRIP
ncbi:MAG: DUF4276 family protein [Candidatus Eremiobacterota bacterium]